MFKEGVVPIFYKLFQNIEEGTLSYSSDEANITMVLKPDKDITRKENNRSISHECMWKYP